MRVHQASFWVALPCLLLAQAAHAQQLIQNRGFESGATNWVLGGSFHASTMFACSHAGSGYAYLSNANGTAGNNLFGTMYQQFTVPAGATAAPLEFWYSITTQEISTTTAFDSLNVTIQSSSGNFLASVLFRSNLHGSSASCANYVRFNSLDLAPYAGQTIRLHFLGTTDSSLPTIFRVDDVSVVATVPNCSYAFNPTSASVGAGSGSYSFSVATGAGCAWSASDNRSWISTSSNGSGNGTVNYSVTQNPDGPRTGTITVQDQSFNITQAGAPTGRCCATNGTCSVTTSANCSGSWSSGGSCSPNPCQQPTGICCVSGSCSVTTSANCSGSWSSGGSCSPNPCQQPTGRCCAANGNCSTTTEANCTGVWTNGLTCSTACPPPTGACCLPGGDCATSTQTGCIDQGGVWQGAGSVVCLDCASAPTGACCVGGSSCSTAVPESACSSVGGAWQGAGSTSCDNCGSGPCPLPSPLCTASVSGQVNGLPIRLPWRTGEEYRVIQGYCALGSYSHDDGFQVDFGTPRETTIVAIAPGWVVQTGNFAGSCPSPCGIRSNGIFVRIQHQASGGVFYTSTYSHLNGRYLGVQCGTYVEGGAPIGYSGNTGWSTGYHLHFQVQRVIGVSTPPVCAPPNSEGVSGVNPQELEKVRPVRMVGRRVGTLENSICDFVTDQFYRAIELGGGGGNTCPADYDGDGVTSVSDIFAFLALWFANELAADFDNSGLPVAVPDIFAFLTAWFAGCQPLCRVDFNEDGSVTVGDIFAFLSGWFAQDPRADFDGTPGFTVADIFAFLSAWFAGCP